MRKIISLTSIPPRFAELGPTLASLVGQGADEVWLTIPQSYGRFADWDGRVPPVPEGVTITRCDHDYGPATKILPTCQALNDSGQDAQVLFCDDDAVFAPGWAQRLFDWQMRRPDQAVTGYVRPAHGYVPNPVAPLRGPQARQIPIRWDVPYRFQRLIAKLTKGAGPWHRPFVRAGYGEVFFGAGGVVVRPGFFDAVSMQVPPEVWAVDDIWLSAQMARKGVPIYCPRRHQLPKAQDHAHTDALLDMQIEGQDRQDLNKCAAVYCRDRFGIWQETI